MNRRSFLSGLGALVAAASAGVGTVAARAYLRSGLRPITALDGANQIGYHLITSPAHQEFKIGDIIAIEGVFAINQLTKKARPVLRQFVLTADVPKGTRIFNIYPPLAPVEFVDEATVSTSPRNLARINMVSRLLPASQCHDLLAYDPRSPTTPIKPSHQSA